MLIIFCEKIILFYYNNGNDIKNVCLAYILFAIFLLKTVDFVKYKINNKKLNAFCYFPNFFTDGPDYSFQSC